MLRRLSIILGYILATIIVVGGTIILIAYGNGYSYDFKSGRLVQRGLVLLDSQPDGASIRLNGRDINEKTPYRKAYEGGSYTFELVREGYRTWTKQLHVIPSRVSLAQYVILLPQRFQVESVATYPSITQSLPSRDRRRVALNVPSGDTAGIWLLDSQNRNQTRIYIIAPPVAGQPAQSLELMSWADDASRLLVKRTIGDQVSYLIVSANPSDAVINLSEQFQTSFNSLTFNPSNARELYWISPDGLRRLDTGNRSVTPPLAAGVVTYSYAGDRILYIDKLQPPARLWSLERDGTKQQLADNLPPSSAYQIAYATYINTPQAVVIASDTRKAMWYHNIYDDEIRSTEIATPATQALFNSDGRFVLLTDDTHTATYDLEHDRLHRFPEINSTITGASWFDTYHLQFNRDGQTVMSEFDGNYAVAITRSDSLPPFNSTDDKYIYATAATSTGATQIKALKIRD
jgi:hypothetical protein